MRGKESDDGQRKTIGRITPAYAGKRLSGGGSPSSTRDHPRLCGEKSKKAPKCKQLLGSPPPMRGKEGFFRSKVRGVRITPAYAGKSRFSPYRRRKNEDHPRLCGEKWRGVNIKFSAQGSPPPMRGKVTVSSSSRVTMGITPAYAGKRNAMTVVKIVKKDHPRLCGEKSSVGLCSDKIIGSPPPMRGKDNIYFVKTDRDRITPAYAGKRHHSS